MDTIRIGDKIIVIPDGWEVRVEPMKSAILAPGAVVLELRLGVIGQDWPSEVVILSPKVVNEPPAGKEH